MATPTLKEKVIQNESIPNFLELKKDFQKNQLKPTIYSALKQKLTTKYLTSTISDEELELLTNMFRRERSKGTIDEYSLEKLSRIEMAKCTDSCRVKADDASLRLFHLQPGQVCKYRIDDDSGRYYVYFNKTIKSMDQISKEIRLREERGHFPDPDSYPKDRLDAQQRSFNEKEFLHLFEVEDENALEYYGKENRVVF